MLQCTFQESRRTRIHIGHCALWNLTRADQKSNMAQKRKSTIPRNIAKPIAHINEDKTSTSPRHRYRSEIHAEIVAAEYSIPRNREGGTEKKRDGSIFSPFENDFLVYPPIKATPKGGTVIS